ncbi:hypothetical protein EON83_26655 [bacterium]|nr:MAG: hypothetical protein EON83_26655 [bacterium]
MPLTYYRGRTTLPPSDFANLFKFVVLLGVLFPSLFTLLSSTQLLPQLLRKSGAKYQLTSIGVSSRDWQHSFSFGWERIESYRFADHVGIPGVRVAQFYVQPTGPGASHGKGVWRTLDFDPSYHSRSRNRIAASTLPHLRLTPLAQCPQQLGHLASRGTAPNGAVLLTVLLEGKHTHNG